VFKPAGNKLDLYHGDVDHFKVASQRHFNRTLGDLSFSIRFKLPNSKPSYHLDNVDYLVSASPALRGDRDPSVTPFAGQRSHWARVGGGVGLEADSREAD